MPPFRGCWQKAQDSESETKDVSVKFTLVLLVPRLHSRDAEQPRRVLHSGLTSQTRSPMLLEPKSFGLGGKSI